MLLFPASFLSSCLGMQILIQALLGEVVILRAIHRHYTNYFAKQELGKTRWFPSGSLGTRIHNLLTFYCSLFTFLSKYSTIAAARAGMVNAAGSIRGMMPYSASVAVVMGPMEATVATAASS